MEEEKSIYSEKQLEINRDREIKKIELKKGIIRIYRTPNENWNKNYDQIKWDKKK
jgi:hypothetical protein